jgi:hypothetical protein
VIVALVAALFVYLTSSSYFDARRYRSRFAALAREFGQDVGPSRKLPLSFSTVVGGRPFEIRHDYKSNAHTNYRGPQGHLLISATRLSAPRWELHQIDIQRGGVRLRKLARHKTSVTGDAAFDARFSIREDGIPVRADWLDAPTRAAVEHFYESAAAQGVVWIQEQQVLHLVRAPWKGIDGATLRSLLERQASLASSLDRTAGWRVETLDV